MNRFEKLFTKIYIVEHQASLGVFLFQITRFSKEFVSFICAILSMDQSLFIEINDNDEACVETTVIKARRRRAHICLAIQQIGIFLFACIVVAYNVWYSVRNQI